jgi:hypothetical protein
LKKNGRTCEDLDFGPNEADKNRFLSMVYFYCIPSKEWPSLEKLEWCCPFNDIICPERQKASFGLIKKSKYLAKSKLCDVL